jgi:hypothetical protein
VGWRLLAIPDAVTRILAMGTRQTWGLVTGLAALCLITAACITADGGQSDA